MRIGYVRSRLNGRGCCSGYGKVWRMCFVYTMVIKTELWTRVHSPVVRAADCRSAGPWFNSRVETLDPYSLACEPNHNYNHNANDNDSTKVS